MRRIPRPHPVLIDRARRGLGAVSVLPPATVSTIAGTIQKVEGYYPGSLAYANNNPGNLIFVGQPGATLGAGGFARFENYADGLAALNNQIQLYASRGYTIQGMMGKYAPAYDNQGRPTGNDPASYAQSVAGALGVPADTPLALIGGAVYDVTPLPEYAATPPEDLTGVLPAETGIDPMTLGIAGAAGLTLLWLVFGD